MLRNVQGTDITSKRNVQGTDITSEENIQGTDIKIERNVQGQTLQANHLLISCRSIYKTSLLYMCLLNKFTVHVYTE